MSSHPAPIHTSTAVPRWIPVLRAALLGMALGMASTGRALEFHVRTTGNDGNPGTSSAPFRTIQAAAEHARPGDIIRVHAGVYRERVNPPRGGTSDEKRIVYHAAPGERVEIKGSEVVTGWVRVRDGVWKVSLPDSFFGGFNPFADRIHGDWFDPRGRAHHTGAVYLEGDWLAEAASLEAVLEPAGKDAVWFARARGGVTEIWARFGDVDPNTRLTEVNVRRTVFYPDQPGRDFLTVRGFVLSQAATPWAPPTAEQPGLIGTHWSRGWIIESNVVSHSVCSGIALGKYGDRWDNTSADTAEGYVQTVERALANGWSREKIGHHVVRGNVVSHCEQAGIVGSLGAAFSTVEGNTIHDIHVRRLFSGAEMAGIKFHGAIDTVIRDNHVYRTVRGLWLDWMAQGTRVSGNLFHDNAAEDLFIEVNHGPFMVDNNLLLSGTSLLDMSEGGAYVHNLFAGRLVSRPEPDRRTPFHPPHSTTLTGLAAVRGGDDRFFNNLFVGAPGKPESSDARHSAGYGTWVYDGRPLPTRMGGNVYLNGARPSASETNALVRPSMNPKVRILDEGDGFKLRWQVEAEVAGFAGVWVHTTGLGAALVSGARYERADGTTFAVDRDFLGRRRHRTRPTPGPIERPEIGEQEIRLR